MDETTAIETLRNEDSVDFDKERYDYLNNKKDIYYMRIAALFLSEAGYSHSGIANELDVTESTSKGYLTDLKERFGKNAIESKPQINRTDELHKD